MEDICVLYAALKSDHAGLVDRICGHGRGVLAAVYERLHADNDFYCHAVYSGTLWRRVPQAHAVRERAVSSYAVSGAVGALLCDVGRTFVGLGGSGGDHICVWNHDAVHEL